MRIGIADEIIFVFIAVSAVQNIVPVSFTEIESTLNRVPILIGTETSFCFLIFWERMMM